MFFDRQTQVVDVHGDASIDQILKEHVHTFNHDCEYRPRSVRLCILKLRHSAEAGWRKRIIYINFWTSELNLSARRFWSCFGLFTFSHLGKRPCLPRRKVLGARKVRVPTVQAALKALILLMMSIWRPLAWHAAAGLVSAGGVVQMRKTRTKCVFESTTMGHCCAKGQRPEPQIESPHEKNLRSSVNDPAVGQYIHQYRVLLTLPISIFPMQQKCLNEKWQRLFICILIWDGTSTVASRSLSHAESHSHYLVLGIIEDGYNDCSAV